MTDNNYDTNKDCDKCGAINAAYKTETFGMYRCTICNKLFKVKAPSNVNGDITITEDVYEVRVWPDGTWIGEDDWETLPEDFSDDYYTLKVPGDTDDIEQYIIDNTPGL